MSTASATTRSATRQRPPGPKAKRTIPTARAATRRNLRGRRPTPHLRPVERNGLGSTGPRIYVADLASYNAGRLHGVWIDAAQDLDRVALDLHASAAPVSALAAPQLGVDGRAVDRQARRQPLEQHRQRVDRVVDIDWPILFDRTAPHRPGEHGCDVDGLIRQKSVLRREEHAARRALSGPGFHDPANPDLRHLQRHDEAVAALFETLDWLEARLATRRFLLGAAPTEADWRLFPTLLRFDPVYVLHFKCNRKRLVEYPNLWAYTRDLYQWPGVAATVRLDHIKAHYFASHRHLNPSGIVPLGPALDFAAPHGRARLREAA